MKGWSGEFQPLLMEVKGRVQFLPLVNSILLLMLLLNGWVREFDSFFGSLCKNFEIL